MSSLLTAAKLLGSKYTPITLAEHMQNHCIRQHAHKKMLSIFPTKICLHEENTIISVFCIAREIQARRNSDINESDQGITLGKIYLVAKTELGFRR